MVKNTSKTMFCIAVIGITFASFGAPPPIDTLTFKRQVLMKVFQSNENSIVVADCDKHVYDGYDSRCKEYHIHYKPNHSQIEEYKTAFERDSIQYLLIRLLDFQKIGSTNQVLVSCEIIPNDFNCSPCIPLINCSIVQLIDTSITMITRGQNILNVGGNGYYYAKPQQLQIGINNYAFSYEWMSTQMGYTETGIELLTVVDNDFKKILSTTLGITNEGSCETKRNTCWGYSSTLTPLKSEKQFFDIKMVQSGTKDIGAVIQNFNKTALFVWQNNAYVRN